MRGRFRSLGVLIMVLVTGLNMTVAPFFHGSEALDYSMDSNLSEADASFVDDELWNWAGYSVAGAGDVNGDGYHDILIGAPWNSTGGWGTGRAHLILGKASGWAADTDLDDADASFIGSTSGERAGFSVAGAGDVNGDGYDDMLISAPWNSTDASGNGQTFLVLGKSTGWDRDAPLSQADASFVGESDWQACGYSVSGAGDVNGDGLNDILIGAPYDGENGWGSGKVYLVFGRASGWAMNTDLSKADASFVGNYTGDYAGWAVAGAGDVNGDGYDDVLVGAPYNDSSTWSTGTTYLIFGKSSGWKLDVPLPEADASFTGEAMGDMAGMSVAGAGDVNGDGYHDILIGAPYSRKNGYGTGQAYLIFGRASGWEAGTTLSVVSASFLGEVEYDNLGFSVSGAGDVNGDGYDDMLIGGPGNDTGGNTAGQSYLILGKASGWKRNTNMASSDASFLGEDAMDQSGRAVAGAGDVNGDGYDDILIGAPWWNITNGYSSGKVYLVFPDHNTRPLTIDSVKVHPDITFTTETDVAYLNQTVYIELQGTDGNAARRDTAVVNVRNDDILSIGYNIRLIETGPNTGRYRGGLAVMERTHEDNRWIEASVGDTVTVTSVQETSRSASVTVIDTVTLHPLDDNISAREDTTYEEHYEAVGLPEMAWAFDTNASWLEWDTTEHNISAIPDNGDVGSYWVRINVTDAHGEHDEHNFTLTVENVPPDILTSDVTEAVEEVDYRVDYNSTDDGQGNISWHLDTDAGDWLTMDPSTGLLNGTPSNEHVGEYTVNVSVSDGNGGWAWSEFVLRVKNTNNRPAITTEDVVDAYEDSYYVVDYDAEDRDEGDILSWRLDTDAGGWLAIDPATGNLSGIPTNDDVGRWWVNVTVADTSQARDHHNFTIMVHNTNDIPVITSEPVTKAKTLARYVYDVAAVDVDVGDVLSYSLDIRPEGMDIDGSTGLIEWTPSRELIGIHNVVVNVSDGASSVTQRFDIEVSENDPPVITSEPATRGYIDVSYIYQVEAEDPDNDPLDLLMVTSPAGMRADGSRQIRWTPGRAGDFPVILVIRDEHGATYGQSWTITVTEMPELSVSIGSPRALDSAWGRIRVGGTAAISEGVLSAVEVKAGDSDWMVATGTSAWYLDLDISHLPEGEHVISARSTDGYLHSDPVSIQISIKEPRDEGKVVETIKEDVAEPDLYDPCWGVLLLVLFGSIILFIWRRMTTDVPRYRPPKEEGAGVEEPEDDGSEEDADDDLEIVAMSNEEVELQCPVCGIAVDDEVDECPECGTEFELDDEVDDEDGLPEQDDDDME